jgi:hypothetical protein
VLYKLQSTNRATYFMQRRDNNKVNVIDPNYEVASLIAWDGSEATYLPKSTDQSDIRNVGSSENGSEGSTVSETEGNSVSGTGGSTVSGTEGSTEGSSSSGTGGSTEGSTVSATTWGDDFVHLTDDNIYSFHLLNTENTSSTGQTTTTPATASSTTPANCLAATRRNPDIKDSEYIGGFYCLENTCDNQWDALCSDLPYALSFWRAAPAKVVTSLIIRARYTPSVIYTAKCYEGSPASVKPEIFDKEAEAQQKLKDEGNPEALSKDPDACTFYCINGRYCYTYLGMLASIEYAKKKAEEAAKKATEGSGSESVSKEIAITAERDNYVEFVNGYCYYQEYFTDLQLDDLGNTKFGGVERNKFYVLRCTEITAPTTTETGIVITEVYCDFVDWQEVSAPFNEENEKDNITLRPNKQ